jgi:flavorubredoxin
LVLKGDIMQVLIAYDSVSSAKLTAKAAEAIAQALREEGLEVISAPVGDARQLHVEEYDCLLIGSPTMAWAPTKPTKEFLDGLKGRNFAGKYAASFDTQIRSIISGNANKALESKLKGLGYTIAHPHLQVFVRSENKVYGMVEGEMEKATAWARELADNLRKASVP